MEHLWAIRGSPPACVLACADGWCRTAQLRNPTLRCRTPSPAGSTSLTARLVWWSAQERGALALAGGRHRLVMQNGHLLLSAFWLACGFLIAQCVAAWNERRLQERTIYL